MIDFKLNKYTLSAPLYNMFYIIMKERKDNYAGSKRHSLYQSRRRGHHMAPPLAKQKLENNGG